MLIATALAVLGIDAQAATGEPLPATEPSASVASAGATGSASGVNYALLSHEFSAVSGVVASSSPRYLLVVRAEPVWVTSVPEESTAMTSPEADEAMRSPTLAVVELLASSGRCRPRTLPGEVAAARAPYRLGWEELVCPG